MITIADVIARQILNSRGNPTIEADVILNNDILGRASVPSGASTSKYEAVEIRDNNPRYYNGLGVKTAIKNIISLIAKKIIGKDPTQQSEIDSILIELDGTENKSSLGANAMLAVSLATARAAALSKKMPLYAYLTKFNPDFKGNYIMPVPQMNVLNGGKHGNWSTDIQEYMLIPVGANSIAQAIQMCAEVYFCLKKILKSQGFSISVGDEGGFAPSFKSNEEPFQILSQAVTEAGYKLKKDICFAIDPAASEFFKDGTYILSKEKKTVSSNELAKFYSSMILKYPIISVEDIFAEDDWNGFKQFTETEGKKIQVVGDDIYATNLKRLQRGIDKHTTNAILIKLNQIGTLTETAAAIILARKHGMRTIISHRSGETEDSFIADFAVAMGTGQIKTGAPCRSERTAKYNELLRIEEQLGNRATFAENIFKNFKN